MIKPNPDFKRSTSFLLPQKYMIRSVYASVDKMSLMKVSIFWFLKELFRYFAINFSVVSFPG